MFFFLQLNVRDEISCGDSPCLYNTESYAFSAQCVCTDKLQRYPLSDAHILKHQIRSHLAIAFLIHRHFTLSQPHFNTGEAVTLRYNNTHTCHTKNSSSPYLRSLLITPYRCRAVFLGRTISWSRSASSSVVINGCLSSLPRCTPDCWHSALH